MAKTRAENQVRIIAGCWRGRKLTFPDSNGLRPTSDRVRETLFNWLQPHLVGACCLDLFAGSGALGFEALSRGAKHVMLVEQRAQVVRALRQNQQQLQAQNVSITQGDAFKLVAQTQACFDIIFLDPPFQLQGLADICACLQQRQWVHTNSLVYVESAHQQDLALPLGWHTIKAKKAGNVRYSLVDCTGE